MDQNAVLALARTALTRAVPSKDEKAATALVPDGCSHAFEVTAKVTGRLTRGAAGSQSAKSKLLNWAVVADLLRRCGVTRAAAEKHLKDIAAEAIATGGDIAEALIDANPEILIIMRDADKNVVDALPATPKRGEIRVMGAIDWRQLKIDGHAFDAKTIATAPAAEAPAAA